MIKRFTLLKVIQNLLKSESISTSATLNGKRNFRKFPVINKRGTRLFKEQQRIKPHPNVPIDHRGVRPTGYYLEKRFVEVPEMIPELIVPNLDGCDLKPYVSYKTSEIHQPGFTSLDLFNAIYANKVMNDFNNNKLKENGEPLEPSEHENLTPDAAWIKARKSGSDIY